MALRGKNKRAHSTDSTFLLIFYSVKEVSAQQNWKLHFRKEKEVNIFRNKSEKSGYVIWGTLVLHCLTEEHIFLHPVIFKTVGKCPLEICSVYRGRFLKRILKKREFDWFSISVHKMKMEKTEMGSFIPFSSCHLPHVSWTGRGRIFTRLGGKNEEDDSKKKPEKKWICTCFLAAARG